MAPTTSIMENGKKFNISEIYSSPTFKFLVGPDKKEFFIHKSLVAKLSPALDRLVNNGMKEAREGCVEWPDVDEDTFSRFAEFAYTGNYPAAEPDILLGEDDIGKHPASDAENSQDGPPAKKRRTGNGPQDLRQVIEIESDDSDEGNSEEDVHSSSDSSSGSEDDDEEEDDDDEDDDEEDASDDEEDYRPAVKGNHSNGNGGHQNGDNYYEDEDDTPDGKSHWCRSSAHQYQHGANHTTMEQLSYCISGASAARAKPVHSNFCLPYSLKEFINADEAEHHAVPHFNRLEANHICYCYGCHGPTPQQASRSCRVQLMKMLAHLPQCTPAEGVLKYEPPDFKVPRNNTKNDSLAPVLMCHAKLWVLGDIYDIPKLRLLAATQIGCTLMWFTLYEERAGDIAQVARYVYENSCDTGEVVGLRPMLALYLAAIMEDVAHTAEIKDLLTETGELARDVMLLMVRRVQNEMWKQS